MAHECPVCGLPCHCKDADDCLTNFPQDVANCVHCQDKDNDDDDECDCYEFREEL